MRYLTTLFCVFILVKINAQTSPKKQEENFICQATFPIGLLSSVYKNGHNYLALSMYDLCLSNINGKVQAKVERRMKIGDNNDDKLSVLITDYGHTEKEAEMRIIMSVKRNKNTTPSIGNYKKYIVQKDRLKVTKIEDVWLNEYFSKPQMSLYLMLFDQKLMGQEFPKELKYVLKHLREKRI